MRLVCERRIDNDTRFLDCGQILPPVEEWQIWASGAVGELHHWVTFRLVYVPPTATDELRQRPKNAAGALLYELPLPNGCKFLDSLNILINAE